MIPPRFILFAVFLCLGKITVCQVDSVSAGYETVIGLRGHYGFIIIHSKDLRDIQNSYPWGLELDIGRHFATEKAWESCLCYPRAGAVFSYFYFDNPDILGSGLLTMAYVEPFFRSHKKLNFSIKGAAGIVYLTNPHDSITNPDNISYSTTISGMLMLQFGLNYRLTRAINLSLAAVYNHTSNGGLKQPNKGINLPTASFGMDYILQPVSFVPRTKIRLRDQHKPEQRFDVTPFLTSRAISAEEQQRFIIYGIEAKYSRQLGRVSAITGGIEWLVDGLAKEKMKRSGGDQVDHQSGSVALGHEFLIGRFLWSQQLGYYAYKPYDDGESIYHRHGFIFRITPHLQAGFNMKVHRHIAQFTDLRIGVNF